LGIFFCGGFGFELKEEKKNNPEKMFLKFWKKFW
jgi:hypothetical protein